MKTDAAENVRHSWSACIICLLMALLVWPAQHFIETHASSSDEDPDILLFSSPEMMQKMALGYGGLMADFYWMRTIQYYARVENANRRRIRYKNLYTLLDITTTLDPDLMDAYRMGWFFLANDEPIGAGNPEDALRLLDKGFNHHPEAWKLLYDKGFVHYWHTKDFKAAGEIWLQASKIPRAPDWLSGLAAMALSRGGVLEIAMALWQEQYLQSTQENVKKAALDRLLSFQVMRDIWGWEALAETYREKTGSYPQSLDALRSIREPHPEYFLIDPLGTPYKYDRVTGAIFLSADSDINYVEVPDIYKDMLIASEPLTILLH